MGLLFKKANNIKDKTFGDLTAIEAGKRVSAEAIMWKFECKCGNTYYATDLDAEQGKVSNCGCAQFK